MATEPSAREPLDGYAFMIDGALWGYFDDKDLFFRLEPGSIPVEFLSEPLPDSSAFLARAKAEATGPPLPVERGDTTRISGVTVDGKLLQVIEHLHAPITWRVWEGWLVGCDSSGALVAVWKLPEGASLLNVFMIEAGGMLWACNGKFFCRIQPPKKHLKQIRKTLCKDASIAPKMLAMLRRGAEGQVVTVTRVGDVVKLGESFVPREQFDAVLALAGREITWRWTSVTEPVVGFSGGHAVAAINPFAPGKEPVPAGALPS